MAQQIPVYLFTGFLEGGKTRIIQESMEDKRFNSGEKTLMIQCEDGIEELDPTRFFGQNVYFEKLDDPEQLTTENLTAMQKKHRIDRVIIEYNGMWMLSDLYNAMPQSWYVFQQILFADAGTFITYNQNMRQLMVDKLQYAEMVVINRTTDKTDKDAIHKIVRGISRQAQIAYDYPDGHVEYDETVDPLPFDLDAPVVHIEDRDYAIWYRDMYDELNKYAGKKVTFKGIVARNESMGQNTILCGRHIMTCCAADIAYNGLVCILPGKPELKTGDWAVVMGTIRVEKHKLYRAEGPVLYIETIQRTNPLPDDQAVATFY
ncbi:MAG: GTPase [Clostridia bacterium]|nr:GTPase [Clostridia bacterium]